MGYELERQKKLLNPGFHVAPIPLVMLPLSVLHLGDNCIVQKIPAHADAGMKGDLSDQAASGQAVGAAPIYHLHRVPRVPDVVIPPASLAVVPLYFLSRCSILLSESLFYCCSRCSFLFVGVPPPS